MLRSERLLQNAEGTIASILAIATLNKKLYPRQLVLG